MVADISEAGVKQMKECGRIMNEGIGAVNAAEEMRNAPWQDYYNDLSSERLNSEMVEEARRKEIADVNKHKVYKKVPITKCYDAVGKAPIGTR